MGGGVKRKAKEACASAPARACAVSGAAGGAGRGGAALSRGPHLPHVLPPHAGHHEAAQHLGGGHARGNIHVHKGADLGGGRWLVARPAISKGGARTHTSTHKHPSPHTHTNTHTHTRTMVAIRPAKRASRWRMPSRSTRSSRNEAAADIRMPPHSGTAPRVSSSTAIALPMTSGGRGVGVGVGVEVGSGCWVSAADVAAVRGRRQQLRAAPQGPNHAPWMSEPMIATSAMAHSSSRGARGRRARQCCARFRRVTTPSFAACIWRM